MADDVWKSRLQLLMLLKDIVYTVIRSQTVTQQILHRDLTKIFQL